MHRSLKSFMWPVEFSVSAVVAETEFMVGTHFFCTFQYSAAFTKKKSLLLSQVCCC